MMLASKLLAEFIGTSALVFTILASAGNYLVCGAAFTLILLLIGKISGGAINPAVAIVMYKNNALNVGQLYAYIFVEILGGLFAYYLYSNVAWK